MLLDKLEKKGLISPPSFVISNCMYLTITGSHAYGVADTSVKSSPPDYDIYGFSIPPKDYIFPHLRGEIAGFGSPGNHFDQWQKHRVQDRPDGVPPGLTYEMIVGELHRRLCEPNGRAT